MAESFYFSNKVNLQILQLELEGTFKNYLAAGQCLKPDLLMEVFWQSKQDRDKPKPISNRVQYGKPLNAINMQRTLHHHAVDLFYDCLSPKRKGASSFSDDQLEYMLSLREKGKSYGEIAKILGLPTTPPLELRRSTDKVRKRLKKAEGRLRGSFKKS